MSPEELAKRFDISISAARLRFQELERMKRRKDGIKRPLPAGVVEFLKSAQQRGLRVTSLDND
ncbi:MAG: hypothetical protein K2Y71_30310 [Xanthobacteraceae bacterium]|nr:hypothetical protein [Xanthobacteraceae bacterium]